MYLYRPRLPSVRALRLFLHPPRHLPAPLLTRRSLRGQLEEDILLMRETLQAKVRESQVLKQKLGITVWTEFTQDVNQSLQSVKQSQA